MTSDIKLLESLAAFHIREQGFINDGYKELFFVDCPQFLFVKLYHKNGNRISLKLDLETYEISQL